jgi:ADP-ribose pyrophosphatase YjhB (NUDIX family)
MQTIGVGVAIIEAGKILLTKRRDFPVWCVPGGHLAPKESVLEAAVREAKEETGLTIEITGFVGLYSLPNKWQDGACEIILRGKSCDGTLLTSTNETVDAAYFSRDELPKNIIGWQFHQIEDALSGRSGRLSILDTRLSIARNRENVIHLLNGGQLSMDEVLEDLCARPNRFDL